MEVIIELVEYLNRLRDVCEAENRNPYLHELGEIDRLRGLIRPQE